MHVWVDFLKYRIMELWSILHDFLPGQEANSTNQLLWSDVPSRLSTPTNINPTPIIPTRRVLSD